MEDEKEKNMKYHLSTKKLTTQTYKVSLLFGVTHRCQGTVTSSKTKWGVAFHRFGTKFDHSLLSIEWTWRIRSNKTPPRPDFETMTPESWTEFDSSLNTRLNSCINQSRYVKMNLALIMTE